MPPQDDASEVVKMFQGLPQDRQAALLQKMSPEQKTKLNDALDTHLSAPAVLKQRIQALAAQNKTSLPEVKPDQTIPQYLQNIFMERGEANQQAAQKLANVAHGPEAEKHNLFVRSAAAQASIAPEIAAVLDKVGAGMMDPKSAATMVASKITPALAAGYFLYQGLKSAGQEGTSGKVFSKWPNPDSVQNFLLGLSTAAGAGASIGETAPKSLANAADTLHKSAQHLAGAGAEQTTAPMVQKVAEENGRVAAANRKRIEAADQQNKTAAIKVEKRNQGITDDAFREAGERRAKHEAAVQERESVVQEQQRAYAKDKAEAEAYNEQVQRVEAQRAEYGKALQDGSLRLGESIKSLDGALREEAGDYYGAVRKATEKDPGEPLVDLSKAARHAESQILKGSAENIKQLRELIRKAPEAEGIQTSAGFAAPGDPLYDALVAQGAIGTGGTLPFDQLQGYSSEIGSKLASGNLPGDVYQALKYVKEAIDAQKTTIAQRNGVGPQLKVADSFWADYQNTFYNKPSAVAATMQRVGKFDPQFYAEPFTKGKTAETGISALRNIKTTKPATRAYIDQTVALANSLRETQAAMGKLPKTTHLKPIPEPPKPPAPIPRPTPVEATFKAKPDPKQPKLEPRPQVPTEEEIRAAKKAEIEARGAQWRGLNRYEIGFLLGSPIATFIKGGIKTALVNLAADVGYIAGKQIAANVIVKPRVIDWLSKPRPEDFALLKKLPQADQSAVRSNMQTFIRTEGVKNVSPLVISYIAGGASQQKSPGQMKRDLKEIQQRHTQPASSNPF